LTGLIPSKDDKEAGPLNAKHAERLYAFTLMWCVGAFLISPLKFEKILLIDL
jgi:hypothetical protein